MKVLFLDHDGVVCLSDQWGGRYKKSGYSSDPSLPMDLRMDNFDLKAVKVLNEIIDKTGCEIVVSSDWKRWGTLDQIRDMYVTRGIKPPIDVTPFFSDLVKSGDVSSNTVVPHFSKLEFERHLEILNWLKLHPEVTKWAVIDDLDMSKKFRPEFSDTWGLDNFVLSARPYREGIKQSGLKEKIINFLM
jgi:hypothetical protein